jgi:hypothetical protein
VTNDWRPQEGGHVALNDDGLARIGYAAVTEAVAKATAASALRVLERLTEQEWVSLERTQFKQIVERLERASRGIDEELIRCVSALAELRKSEQELRHIIIHVVWGQGANDDGKPDIVGYDYGRAKLITSKEIDDAVNGCAKLRLAASQVAMRVAELIDDGVLKERADGRGMSIRTDRRLVRL